MNRGKRKGVKGIIPKAYVVRVVDGKLVAIPRRRVMGESIVWSGYATDSKTAVQAAQERPESNDHLV